MSKESIFLIYCMERYRYYHKLSGKEVAIFFDEHKLYSYVMRYFEALHTMGDRAIMQDIEDYVAERNKE